MHIVFAASECVPFAKTGGLADVVGALPPELVRLGHRVTVYLPLYRSVRGQVPEAQPVAIGSLTIPFPYYNRFVSVVDGGLREGVQYYFVDCPELFDREGLYGPRGGGDYVDNAERFGLFSRAVLEAVKLLGVPDLFHVHDWQTAILPVLLRTLYVYDPVLRNVGVVLTVHNAGYQGWFPPRTTETLLLPWDIFTFDRVEQNDTFNFLKGGVVMCDYMTTVSPTYAREIQGPEFGSGLESLFSRRHWDLRGILNGVDYAQWDPSCDAHLAAHYSAADLSGKAECRRDVLHAFGLEHIPDSTPVLGIVSRFATQKGFDMLAAISDQLGQREIALVALGTGEPFYEQFFRSFAARYPEKVAVQTKYDDAIAHKIEAGADLFLMPSRYEPCGLNQIYSMKYGTIPVVRATGGLEDTVEEWNADRRTGTGFKFAGYHPGDFLWAIDRALWVFANDRDGWRTLMQNGMARDYSWEHPAREYVEVYEEVLRRRG